MLTTKTIGYCLGLSQTGVLFWGSLGKIKFLSFNVLVTYVLLSRRLDEFHWINRFSEISINLFNVCFSYARALLYCPSHFIFNPLTKNKCSRCVYACFSFRKQMYLDSKALERWQSLSLEWDWIIIEYLFDPEMWAFTLATITLFYLSAAILFKLVHSCLNAFNLVQWRVGNSKESARQVAPSVLQGFCI